MSANLTDEQKLQLARWVSEGATLADVQKRLAAEFGVSLTYMDARFLLDDLNLVIKDPAKPAPSPTADLGKSPPPAGAPPGKPGEPIPFPGAEPGAAPGRVRVIVDKIIRPGAVVSGSVTFSDNQIAEWYLDQAGRLGLVPKVKGYQPKPAEVQEFQYALQDELARMGY